MLSIFLYVLVAKGTAGLAGGVHVEQSESRLRWFLFLFLSCPSRLRVVTRVKRQSWLQRWIISGHETRYVCRLPDEEARLPPPPRDDHDIPPTRKNLRWAKLGLFWMLRLPAQGRTPDIRSHRVLYLLLRSFRLLTGSNGTGLLVAWHFIYLPIARL